jgi:hypothetical protein
MITMACRPEQNQSDSPIQTVREKNSIKDQRGWLVLNPTRQAGDRGIRSQTSPSMKVSG